MKCTLSIVAMLCLLTTALAQSDAADPTDGQLRTDAAGDLQAWNAQTKSWVKPEAFWAHYAARPGGRDWGKRKDYPPYSEVRELDTLIIQLDTGACLMEFWHQRWRRANDVRRWDPAFNGYGGCPRVFD